MITLFLLESTTGFQKILVQSPEFEVVFGCDGAGVVCDVEGPVAVQVQDGLEVAPAPVEVEDGYGRGSWVRGVVGSRLDVVVG